MTAPVKKNRPQVSDEQLQYLEYLIWRSKDADEFSKKALIWLVRQSKGLTREVELVRPTAGAIVSLHDMCSCGCRTHINELFGLAGSKLAVDYATSGYIIDYALGPGQHNFIKTSPSDEEILSVVPANPYNDENPS